jgi:hypothetical protein
MKQTAVEWLADEIIMLEERLRQEEINLNDFMDLKDDLVTKALEMEKEQIVKAAYEFMGTNFDSNMGRAEQYYNGTYKQQEQ